jgi:GTPase
MDNLITKYPNIIFTIDNSDLILSAEPDDGNIEYKRHLCDDMTPLKLNHLATQMAWRISQCDDMSALMHAIYYIGVDDNGSVFGLDELQIIMSIDNLCNIIKIINARIDTIIVINVNSAYVIKCNMTIVPIIPIVPS